MAINDPWAHCYGGRIMMMVHFNDPIVGFGRLVKEIEAKLPFWERGKG